MISNDFKMPESQVKDYTPIPAGIYQCQLSDIDLKTMPSYDDQSVMEEQFLFRFTVLEEGDFYGKEVSAWASKKLVGGQKPSNLYRILTGVLGRQFTKEECLHQETIVTSDFLNSLLGKQNILAVSQKEKQKGGMKNVIDSILPVKAQLPPYVEKSDDLKAPF
jgi:hypothetical protein